jgi:general secretion pathway protein M
MTLSDLVQKSLARSPLIACASFFVLIVALIFFAWSGIADLIERNGDVRAASELLERLQGHPAGGGRAAPAAAPGQSGSAFLEGATVTVAGAALLQRVSDAIAHVKGNVLSSQVDLQGSHSKNGFIDVIVSFEVEQQALQRLLYDLEAGMPFLFVDQFVAQAPVASASGGEGRMRILLSVSGQWKGGG